MDAEHLHGRRLEQLFGAVKDLGFDGINVTFPFKQAILPLLDEISSDARQIGAVNTDVAAVSRPRRAFGHSARAAHESHAPRFNRGRSR